jgi:hypothetical protein
MGAEPRGPRAVPDYKDQYTINQPARGSAWRQRDRLVPPDSAVDMEETPATVGDIVETTEHRPTSPIGADEAEFIKAARTDDTGRFALLTERFRRELLATAIECSRRTRTRRT